MPWFPEPATVLLGRWLPERATPAGYAALIAAYKLCVPLPSTLSATGKRHRAYLRDGWQILTPRHAPRPTLAGHLSFAFKYEGLDLCVLKRLFAKTGPLPIENIVKSSPTGGYARRAWFLYEWLIGNRLDLPDATGGRYVEIVDPACQFAIDGRTASRQRVRDKPARHAPLLPAGLPHRKAGNQ